MHYVVAKFDDTAPANFWMGSFEGTRKLVCGLTKLRQPMRQRLATHLIRKEFLFLKIPHNDGNSSNHVMHVLNTRGVTFFLKCHTGTLSLRTCLAKRGQSSNCVTETTSV